MIQLSSPHLLFNKQKMFRFSESVEKKSISHPVTGVKIVLVYDYQAGELPDPLKEMLDKLVQACKFKPEEALYLNVAFSKDISIGSLQNNQQDCIVLVFGDLSISKNMPKLKKHFPYEMNHLKVICTENIGVMDSIKGAKKSLWECIQKVL